LPAPARHFSTWPLRASTTRFATLHIDKPPALAAQVGAHDLAAHGAGDTPKRLRLAVLHGGARLALAETRGLRLGDDKHTAQRAGKEHGDQAAKKGATGFDHARFLAFPA
jgi:hypothetical protein